MSPERQVYLLDPSCLKPEVIAVAFAKTSRSPQTFREIAAELTDEKSTEFHEKWVVGYGHSSVAEHAVLHIAVENLSRLAVETLESNRLASYTEKSTRYQKWGRDDFFTPPELEGHLLLPLYQGVVRGLFDAYLAALPVVREAVAAQTPRLPGESDAAYERRIRSDYVDVCRFLLPAASLANVGVTINARALEHAIRKMLSSPLAEVRQLGAEVKQVAQAEVPTLVKYADAVPYWAEAHKILAEEAAFAPPQPDADWCTLVHHDAQAENRLLAAALFRASNISYAQADELVQRLPLDRRTRLAHTLLGRLGPHDPALRELEHASFSFELVLDQGAYAELKRHRMMTQSPQPLTARLGYAIPKAIVSAGFEPAYCQAIEAARQAYEALADFNPAVAAYVVPNAFNRRVLLSFNLRTAHHFLGLRSAANAHFSIRRVAQRIAAEIRQAAPLFGAYLRVNPDETWQSIEQRFFSQV